MKIRRRNEVNERIKEMRNLTLVLQHQTTAMQLVCISLCGVMLLITVAQTAHPKLFFLARPLTHDGATQRAEATMAIVVSQTRPLLFLV
jgi:hypothetical protein